jgi:hypothetical protein
MSGPTNRRFVRSAWTLLAFQFVAAGGALALAIWAATRVQSLIDQRDLLQARVTQLEARPAPADPPADIAPATENVTVPAEVQVPVAPAPPAPARQPVAGNDGPGVNVHRPPPLQPPVTYVPPRQPPVRYPPPRQPPVTYVPPRQPPIVDKPPVEPPVTFVPPRQPPTRYPPRDPPVTYVPPRQPPVIRPNFPTRPTPTPQQPIPGVTVRPTRPGNSVPPAQQPIPGAARPTRPSGVTIIRPTVTRPQAGAPAATPPQTTIDPRRIRRPRPPDTAPQQEPPK